MTAATGAGFAGQYGMATQTTDYETAETVARFLEIENEAIVLDQQMLYSRAIGLGQYQRGDRARTYKRWARGPVLYPVMNKGMGLLLQQMLGALAVTGASADKTHTVTPDDLTGLYSTVQIGKPSVDGTVNPFTYIGGKILDWEIRQAADDILKIMCNWDFGSGDDQADSLETASYAATQEYFSFNQLAVTLGGSSISPKALTLKGDNGLAMDRRFVGNVKKEPLEAGERALTGTLDFEFEDTTIYDALVAGTLQTNLIATWTATTVIPTTATPFSFKFTVPSLWFTKGYPVVSDEGILQQRVEFKGLNNGTDPIVTIVALTSDTAA